MKSVSANYPRWRFWCLLTLVFVLFIGLFARMVQLTIMEQDFLRKQGNARSLRVVDIPAYRGIITDREGAPLAISSPVDSVWVNPKEFDVNPEDLKQLAAFVSMTSLQIKQLIAANHNREFVYLKRHIAPEVADNIKQLNLNGVNLEREYQRFYPEGEVTAHVLGFTNIDDKGQEGIELLYNDWLTGIPGKVRVVKDRLGHIVENVNVLHPPKPGKNLSLSIDRRLQYLAYRELKKTVEKYKAESGSIVILDVKTGEVLAMVNDPSYNPNYRLKKRDGRYRNRAVVDVFEPGSTVKAFTVVNALASGKYKPNTMIDTSPGWMMVNGNEVKDTHNNGNIDVTSILKRSSNVGVAKLSLSLPPESLRNLFSDVGFGSRTAVEFPGENPGFLPYYRRWKPFTLATFSFGYGVSVTTLQLAQSYQILADSGLKCPVTLMKLEQAPVCNRVIDKGIADNVVNMLESVVEKGGTATDARIPGYRVSGKTGTVRIVGRQGYEKSHHISMFVGLAPASNPRLVAAVIVRDPQAINYYGGLVAGPLFSEVMGGALRVLNVSPDDIKV